jgi:hypothetical protein
MGDAKKALRKVDSQLKAKVDLALIEIRKIYESLDVDDRARLKTWVDELLAVCGRKPTIGPLVSVRLQISQNDEVGSIPIRAFRNAFDIWDRGEDYAPSRLDELVG